MKTLKSLLAATEFRPTRFGRLIGLLMVAMPALIFAGVRPNIVIILADDLGYADVGYNGCKDIPTPNIDAIARRGVRFTRGYASQPVCAPSRAGLMSGMYSQRFGFENNSGPEKSAPANFGLPKNVPTLAEKLKAGGYRTGLVGKWHLGFKDGLRPNDRGFDYFYGFVGGSRSYDPQKSKSNAPLMRNGSIVTDEKDYLTDAFTREAVDFINYRTTGSASAAATSETQPFFLYLSFNAVHLPMENVSKYEEEFKGIADAKRRTYAGMLTAMDVGIGKFMAALRERGLEENTLVFFYSDNGGPTPYTTSSNLPLRGTKGDVYEGGIRVPFLMQWPAKIRAGAVFEKPVIAFDCYATALAAASLPLGATDGKDILPFVSSKGNEVPHEVLFWRFGGGKAVTAGDWKLVISKDSAVQLFDLGTDIGEQNSLTDKNPAKVKELSAKLDAWEKVMMPPLWNSGDARND